MKGFISFLMPFWYPIMTTDHLSTRSIHPVTIMDIPCVLYTKNESSIVCHSDICPHMGGSFARGGWLTEHQNLCCPYHGFEFDRGHYLGISIKDRTLRARKPMTRPMLPLYPIMDYNGYIYMYPFHEERDEEVPRPYFPPEHYSEEFTMIQGMRTLECPIDNLVENLLDMIHISFVHSFGNKELPLPTNIHYEETDERAGKTTFEYEPNTMTISKQIGNQERVIVENEFYLPTTTLTRVIAGNVIKTVFTQTVPISPNRTVLFWTVYRNFWKDPYTPQFTWIGDQILRFLMEKTIDEDESILSRAYSHARKGFLTKYDITIRMYREKRERFRMGR